MASVALANGLNATMLRKWVVEAERGTSRNVSVEMPMQSGAFVPLTMPHDGGGGRNDIRIELQRGNVAHHARVAARLCCRVCGLDARAATVIRIDAVWLAVEPVDMRAGADRLLARVVQVFGAAQAHHGYLFANARASRIKLLVHDGFGVWCAARRLNAGGFEWPRSSAVPAAPVTLTQDQFDALIVGLPWQRLEQMRRITRM